MVYVYIQAEMPDNIVNKGEAARAMAEKVHGKIIMLSSAPSEDYEFRSKLERELQNPSFQELSEKCLSRESFEVAGFTIAPDEEDALAFQILDTINNEAPGLDPKEQIAQLMNAIWYVQTKAIEAITEERKHIQELEDLAETSSEDDFVPLSKV